MLLYCEMHCCMDSIAKNRITSNLRSMAKGTPVITGIIFNPYNLIMWVGIYELKKIVNCLKTVALFMSLSMRKKCNN